MGFVVPDDSRLVFDILIPKEDIMGARMGMWWWLKLPQDQHGVLKRWDALLKFR